MIVLLQLNAINQIPDDPLSDSVNLHSKTILICQTEEQITAEIAFILRRISAFLETK